MKTKTFICGNLLAVAVLTTIAGLNPAAAQNFIFSSSPTVGLGPYAVAAADLRGTGKLDLATANYTDGTVTVLTNNGSGLFGFNATYSVGSGPSALTTADVNGDHKQDLIVANANDSTVTVLTNDGSGNFGFNATYNVGVSPFHVEAVDVYGNGNLALVTCNLGDNTVTVLTNSGGIFSSNATYSVGNGPIFFTVGDVNSDGKKDLIVANLSDSTLTVLTNNGSGGFGFNAVYGVGEYPECVAAADMNGDGKVDLITANYGSTGDGNTLTVLTNAGDGTFASWGVVTVGSGPVYVTAADVNGDGTPDLISGNCGSDSFGNTLTVLLSMPALGLKIPNAGTALVSWSPAWPGYVLQGRTNLSAGSWINVNNPTGTNRITISPATGNNFFRLRHP